MATLNWTAFGGRSGIVRRGAARGSATWPATGAARRPIAGRVRLGPTALAVDVPDPASAGAGAPATDRVPVLAGLVRAPGTDQSATGPLQLAPRPAGARRVPAGRRDRRAMAARRLGQHRRDRLRRGRRRDGSRSVTGGAGAGGRVVRRRPAPGVLRGLDRARARAVAPGPGTAARAALRRLRVTGRRTCGDPLGATADPPRSAPRGVVSALDAASRRSRGAPSGAARLSLVRLCPRARARRVASGGND